MNSRAITGVIAIVAMAACSSNDDADDLRKLSFAARFMSVAALSVPADVVEQIDVELAERREQLVATCMQDAGFDYVVPPIDSVVALGTASSTDPEFVREFGFGISTIGIPDGPANPNDAIRARMSRSVGSSYDTMFAECESEASQAIGREFELERLAGIAETVQQRVAGDAAVVAETIQWRDCFAESGFDSDASTPIELRDEVLEQFLALGDDADPTDFQEYEVAIARDSLDCSEGLQQAIDQVTLDVLDELAPAIASELRSL